MDVMIGLRDLLRRFGVDVGYWPPRLHADVMSSWALPALIRARDINCVLDVGANMGQTGQLLRKVGYKGRIVSFEPSPTVLPTLKALAAPDRSWKIRPIGLSAEAGTGEFHLYDDSVMNSMHSALPDAAAQLPALRSVGTTTITISTLDIEIPQAIEGIDHPRVLLKSDTQGHDLDVLKGAKGGLPPQVVAVLVELSAQAEYQGQPRMTKVMDLLMDDGFCPVAFQPVGRSSDQLRMVDLDGLFMRGLTDLPDFEPW